MFQQVQTLPSYPYGSGCSVFCLCDKYRPVMFPTKMGLMAEYWSGLLHPYRVGDMFLQLHKYCWDEVLGRKHEVPSHGLTLEVEGSSLQPSLPKGIRITVHCHYGTKLWDQIGVV